MFFGNDGGMGGGRRLINFSLAMLLETGFRTRKYGESRELMIGMFNFGFRTQKAVTPS